MSRFVVAVATLAIGAGLVDSAAAARSDPLEQFPGTKVKGALKSTDAGRP